MKIMDTDKLHVKILADLCVANGLHKVVISPGSRNAPLIMAFHNHPDIECFVIPDERSAAYFAIGIAQFTGLPVGIICTSGTAALNYAPAMAEAYYQKIPLVAITADRPPEWIDQLDGQAINQTGMYANFISYQAQLPTEAFSKNEVWHLERIVRDGFLQLKLKNQPVHFNVPIREPLYNSKEREPSSVNYTTFKPIEKSFLEDKDFTAELHHFNKILLVIGMHPPDEEFSNLISRVAAGKNMVVMCETLSNVNSEDTFQIADAWINAIHRKNLLELNPDLIISFGDILLSKPLKQWIRSLTRTEHWLVNKGNMVPDVFQRIERIIHLSSVDFLRYLMDYFAPNVKTFYDSWQQSYLNFARIHDEYMQTIGWSDMHSFRALSKTIPPNSVVHLGNSSPVRYAHFFRWKDAIHFFGNRGTAGIDGTMSTAIGMASQTDKPVILITGDISFFYDSNALWNNYKRPNFKIIVINNKGGNIFSLISGPSETGLLDDYFVTHHPVSIEYLCKAYGIDYSLARNEQDLNSGLEHLLGATRCSLLEIDTDPVVNTNVWKEYFKTIKERWEG